MAFHYQIRRKNFDGNPDEILALCEKSQEIDYELEILGFKDCKVKIDENGTELYCKGKRNVLYVAYVQESIDNFRKI